MSCHENVHKVSMRRYKKYIFSKLSFPYEKHSFEIATRSVLENEAC